METVRTPAIHGLDRSVYELDVLPGYFRTGEFSGLEARFVQCSHWHTSRIEEKSLMVQEALKATYELANAHLPREEREFERFVADKVDSEIDLYAKSGIVMRREDFPKYLAAKRDLENAREKAILAKRYYELVKGGCSMTFINATPRPHRFAQSGCFEKG